MMRGRAPAWIAAFLIFPGAIAGARGGQPSDPRPAAAAQGSPSAEKAVDAPVEATPAADEPASPADQTAPAPDQAAPPSDGAQDALAAQPAEVPDEGDPPSADAMATIDWVIATHDNNNMPFMVIDKVAARVFVFEPSGKKIASAPALLGVTAGDEETPGSGDRELSKIPVEDRQTPAGRFVAKFGRAAGHRDVLWIDYPSAISLHAVINVKNQHRFERLKSPTVDDNRITFGCINVPATFYANVVRPVFKGNSGIVYILPETKPLNEVFLAMPPPAAPAAPAAAPSAQ